MKRVPQIFLAAFLADGLLSLAAIILPAISPLQKIVALAVFISALLLHFVMALTTRLPKRFLLPATIFALLSLPIGLIFADHAAPVLALAQTALGIGLLLLWQRHAVAEEKTNPLFTWVNMFAMGLLNIALVCSFFLLLIFSGLSLVETKTNGYVHIRPEGISLEERWFARDDGKTVRLVGMVHVAKDQFYEDLGASLPEKESVIVLLEGVTDKTFLLQKKLNYDNLADTLGLKSQGDSDFMKNASRKSFDPKDLVKKEKDVGRKIQYWRADVDASDFQASTIDSLEAVANLFASKSLGEIVEILSDPTSPLNQEADNKALMYDIIDMRNEHLIGQMKTALERGNIVVVPWGAMHMPVFEQTLKDWGFKETNRMRRLAFSFQKKPLAPSPAKP